VSPWVLGKSFRPTPTKMRADLVLFLSLVVTCSTQGVVGFQVSPDRVSRLPSISDRLRHRSPSRRSSIEPKDEQWDESVEPKEELGFFDSIKAWFKSDEGRGDIQTYATSLGLALILRLLVVEPRYIPSLSMYPSRRLPSASDPWNGTKLSCLTRQ
jgi:hypothetical protein